MEPLSLGYNHVEVDSHKLNIIELHNMPDPEKVGEFVNTVRKILSPDNATEVVLGPVSPTVTDKSTL